MGGYFSHEIGCTRPDFAGVGPLSFAILPIDPPANQPRCDERLPPIVRVEERRRE